MAVSNKSLRTSTKIGCLQECWNLEEVKTKGADGPNVPNWLLLGATLTRVRPALTGFDQEWSPDWKILT